MITYLTTDKNGEQASLDQEENYRYRPGFERQEDGSYLKLLGDERCITAKREKARILRELENRKNTPETPSTKIFRMTKGETYTLDEIKKMFINPSSVLSCSRRSGVIMAYSTKLSIDLPCEHPKWIGKIEADENNGEIRYWFHQTWTKCPDVCIPDVIVKKHEQPPQEQNTETDQQLVGA